MGYQKEHNFMLIPNQKKKIEKKCKQKYYKKTFFASF